MLLKVELVWPHYFIFQHVIHLYWKNVSCIPIIKLFELKPPAEAILHEHNLTDAQLEAFFFFFSCKERAFISEMNLLLIVTLFLFIVVFTAAARALWVAWMGK